MNIKTLSDLVNEFVDFKRQNGFTYDSAGYYLKKYLAFSETYSPNENIPQKDTVKAFLTGYADTPGNQYNAAAALREFSRYLSGLGYTTAYILPCGKISLPTPVQPYLFTDAEIEKFFSVCDDLPFDPHFPRRRIVLPALYRLLYCCGLRCKEARTLRCENVHLDNNYIDIIQSKGPKSRRLFISQELSDYLYKYDLIIEQMCPGRVFFFPSRKDSPYSAGSVQVNFLKIWYSAYPEMKDSEISVRAYDFRHHFACANLNRWFREGKDINVMLPYLMKYMGHQDIEHTLYYFHLVPEIYDEISKHSSAFESLIPEVKKHA